MTEREVSGSGSSANEERSQFCEERVTFMTEFFEKLPFDKAIERPMNELGVHNEFGSQVIGADVHDAGARVGQDDEFHEDGEI